MPRPAQDTENDKQHIVFGMGLWVEIKHRHDAGNAKSRQAQKDENRLFAAHAVHHGTEGNAQERTAQGGTCGQEPHEKGA